MIEELPSIPRIYTALAQWLSCMVFVVRFRRGQLGSFKLIATCILFLIVQSTFLVATADAPGFLWLLFMAVSWMLMFGLIAFSCGISKISAAYYAVHAFVAAEFAASLSWQIHCFLWPLSDGPLHYAVVLLFTIYAAVFTGIGLIVKHFAFYDANVQVRLRHLLIVAVIGASVFAISNLGFLTTRTPFSGHYHREIFNIRTLMGLSGLLFLGVYNFARREMFVQKELDAVQGILRSQAEQYQHAKDKQDYINRNYHDLKHKIAYLRAEHDSANRNIFLDSMEKEIAEYEAMFKTGNPVLDTILTDNGMRCNENSIVLTCVANGALLNAMDVMDVCTVFGNALGNAIEHAKKIDDPQKRLVHVAVFSKQDYIVIRFENYMVGNLSFEGDLPATTKADKKHHGYGLKSVKYVAEKYKGAMSVEEENGWFVLQLVLPKSNHANYP